MLYPLRSIAHGFSTRHSVGARKFSQGKKHVRRSNDRRSVVRVNYFVSVLFPTPLKQHRCFSPTSTPSIQYPSTEQEEKKKKHTSLSHPSSFVTRYRFLSTVNGSCTEFQSQNTHTHNRTRGSVEPLSKVLCDQPLPVRAGLHTISKQA